MFKRNSFASVIIGVTAAATAFSRAVVELGGIACLLNWIEVSRHSGCDLAQAHSRRRGENWCVCAAHLVPAGAAEITISPLRSSPLGAKYLSKTTRSATSLVFSCICLCVPASHDDIQLIVTPIRSLLSPKFPYQTLNSTAHRLAQVQSERRDRREAFRWAGNIKKTFGNCRFH